MGRVLPEPTRRREAEGKARLRAESCRSAALRAKEEMTRDTTVSDGRLPAGLEDPRSADEVCTGTGELLCERG